MRTEHIVELVDRCQAKLAEKPSRAKCDDVIGLLGAVRAALRELGHTDPHGAERPSAAPAESGGPTEEMGPMERAVRDRWAAEEAMRERWAAEAASGTRPKTR